MPSALFFAARTCRSCSQKKRRGLKKKKEKRTSETPRVPRVQHFWRRQVPSVARDRSAGHVLRTLFALRKRQKKGHVRCAGYRHLLSTTKVNRHSMRTGRILSVFRDIWRDPVSCACRSPPFTRPNLQTKQSQQNCLCSLDASGVLVSFSPFWTSASITDVALSRTKKKTI